ncbi:MAG: EutN/CcmL family microcompartment protein [Acidobacteriota bacterium]
MSNMVATQKNVLHDNARIMLVQPVNPNGTPCGAAVLALDSVDAGEGDLVLVVQEGWGASTGEPGEPLTVPSSASWTAFRTLGKTTAESTQVSNMSTINREALKEMVREAVRQAMSNSAVISSSAELTKPAPPAYFAPWTGVAYEAHASQQKLNIAEASVTLGDLLEFAEAKACTIEKNKPCDQCGMCRSLGF